MISVFVNRDFFNCKSRFVSFPGRSNYTHSTTKEFIQIFSFFFLRAQMNKFIAKRAKNRQPPSTGL